MTDKSITKEELEQIAKFYGAKLAFLIYTSTATDTVKQAWMSLLPDMSLVQLERLTDLLEQQYVMYKTRDVDEKLKKDLEKIKANYDAKVKKLKKIDAMALKKMVVLTKNLK